MTAPEYRRRGIYEIGDDELARLLRLPAGQQIVSVSSSWPRLSLLIMVEGDGLPEVVAGGHAPLLNKWARFHPLTPLDVSKLSPGAAHVAVLAELGAVRFEDPAALAGRARILDRHAPSSTWQAWPGCSNCVAETGAYPDEWPCADYLDAAAGLVTGLPGQADYATALAALAAGDSSLLEQPGPVTAADLSVLADPETGRKIDAAVLGEPGGRRTRRRAPLDHDPEKPA